MATEQPEPRYLGDSVYIRMEGSCFVLYLDNGYGEHTTIVMEPEVVESFDRYREYLKAFNSARCGNCGQWADGDKGTMLDEVRYCLNCLQPPKGNGQAGVGVYIDTNIPDESH